MDRFIWEAKSGKDTRVVKPYSASWDFRNRTWSNSYYRSTHEFDQGVQDVQEVRHRYLVQIKTYFPRKVLTQLLNY